MKTIRALFIFYSIYKEINKLETTEIQELKFYDYDEKYRFFVWIAGILVLLEFGLRATLDRRISVGLHTAQHISPCLPL